MRNSQSSPTTGLRCPVCATHNVARFRMGLYRCLECTAVLNPQIWQEGADRRLEQEWFDDGAYNPEASYWTRLFEKWNCRRTWERVTSHGTAGGRLLEVGVGSGSLLSFMASRGFAVEGCDMAREVCKHVEVTRGYRMHCGQLQSIEGDQSFDVIVMNHVVEHVSDPVGLLTDAARLLKPRGILHIAVPNVGSWEARLSGWTSYQPYHLVYFNPVSLTQAVTRAQLKPIRMSTHEPFSGWFLAVLRSGIRRAVTNGEFAGDRRAKLTGSWAVETSYRLAMLAAGAITWPFCRVQERMQKGEELIVLASRVSDQ
jgi:2-polyprenyl-3-methyl-5-hydroxy-6-metoxy-1,4-benzoquinol methylase